MGLGSNKRQGMTVEGELNSFIVSTYREETRDTMANATDVSE
jgi:hypothetical protein